MIVKPSQRSAPSDLKIVQANPDDIDIVLGILDEAAAWIIEQKIPSVWKPGEFSRENLSGSDLTRRSARWDG